MMRLIDGDALIEKAKYEAEGMEEPYSTDLPVIIDWLVSKMPTEHPEQKAFEWCHDCAEYDQMAHCCHRWTKVIRQTVEELKQEYRGDWILCSKRLPEYGESVLCYYEDDDYGVNHIIDDENGEWFIDGVVAWMPLPKPYAERCEKDE